MTATPEYEDCRRIAEEKNDPAETGDGRGEERITLAEGPKQ